MGVFISRKTRKKGQVEFILVAVLVIIALVAVTLTLQQTTVTPPETPGITEEAKTIKDSIVNVIRAGVRDQMITIYNQGGTLIPDPSVDVGVFDTQVWYACGESSTPDVSEEIGTGILKYLRENLDDEMEFFGKNVKFDFTRASSDVEIMKNKISVRINLPTTVEDLAIQQPYEITFATKLYDVLDFSENFVEDVQTSRFFETVTLSTMLNSNPEHENWLPVTGIQTGCGNVLFKTKSDLLPALKGIIKYTVSHVVWNEKPIKLADNPFYPVNQIGGKFYPDMNVHFEYPLSWDSELDRYFAFSPDPIRIVPRPPMALVPACMAPYSVSYSFRYPVVVMVEDDLMNQWFKFAILVDIQNTQPGECTAEFGGVSDYAEACVKNAQCDARVSVKDTEGNPIEGADVSFYVCSVGLTDANGVAQGKVPCMVSELNIYKQGYRSFGDLYSSTQIENIDVAMKKLNDITIHFYGVPVNGNGYQGDGIFSSYVKDGDIQGITPFTLQSSQTEMVTFASFSPKTPNIFTGEDVELVITNFGDEENLVNDVDVTGLQPVELEVQASVSDNMTGLALGHISYNFTLGEGATDLYVYIPVVKNANINDEENPEYVDPSESTKLTNLLTGEGITPVSTEQQS